MKLYLQLLRPFLPAGITFGIITGFIMALSTNWKVGLGFGVASGLFLLLGVPLILTWLSRWQENK